MTKRMVIMLLLVGAIFGGAIWFQNFKAQMMAQFLKGNAMPPATVTAMKAATEKWQPQWQALANLRAYRQVQISSEVAGIVEAVHFNSGQNVKAGELLLKLDDDTEQAQLQALQASAHLAKTTLQRDRQQLRIHAISQAQVDADEADLAVKQAQLRQQRELIRLRSIRAPFAGRIAIRQLHPGHYLRPGDVITPLIDDHRVYADFTLPQQFMRDLKVGQSVGLQVNAQAKRVFPGVITAINPQVDVSSRNVSVEAIFDNNEGALAAGMFGRVRVQHGDAKAYVTLPQTALSFNAYGATVFVARQEEKEGKMVWLAEQVFVKTGMRRGDQVAILSGVKVDDMVVTSGQMKLKNGTPLIINNTHQPTNDANPQMQGH